MEGHPARPPLPFRIPPHNLHLPATLPQAEVLRREVGRLTAENSRLHADLLREADARAAHEAEAYQHSKKAEAAAAELQYARTAALERAAALERERDGLKAKVRELLCIGQHHGGGGCWEGQVGGKGLTPGNSWMAGWSTRVYASTTPSTSSQLLY